MVFSQVSTLQHHPGAPYDLANEVEEHSPKDSTKIYRYSVPLWFSAMWNANTRFFLSAATQKYLAFPDEIG